MPSDPFLQPILEEPTVDLESQPHIDSDSLFSLKTYKSFTPREWLECSKVVLIILFTIAIICFLIYLGVYTYSRS